MQEMCLHTVFACFSSDVFVNIYLVYTDLVLNLPSAWLKYLTPYHIPCFLC